MIPLDVNGNPTIENCDTIYKGRVKYNEKIVGTNYLKFDGSTNYIGNMLGFSMEGDFKLIAIVKLDVNAGGILGTSNNASRYIARVTTDRIYWYNFGGAYPSTSLSTIATKCDITEWNLLMVERVGTTLYCSIGDYNTTFTCDTSSYIMNIIGRFGTKYSDMSLAYIKVENAEEVSELTLGEGISNKVYDKIDGTKHTMFGTLDDIWQQDTTGLLRPSNLLDGFDLWYKNNLIDNGDFSDGTTGWSLVNETNSSVIVVDEALKCTVGDTKYGISTPHVLQAQPSNTPSGEYLFSFRAKGSIGAIVRVQFQYGSIVTKHVVFTKNNEWEDFKFQVTLVEGSYHRFFFHPYNQPIGSIFYLDNVVLTEAKPLRIPFDTNGNSIKTSGDTIVGYTWKSRNPAGPWLNGSENGLLGYPSPTMRKVDKDIEFIYDISGNAKEYNPSELQFDQEDEHKEFTNINDDTKVKDIVRYKEQLDGSSLVRVNKFIKKP